jgi:hypothetical protein
MTDNNIVVMQYSTRELIREVCAKYGFDNEAFVIELTGKLTRALLNIDGTVRRYTADDIKEMAGEALASGQAEETGLREDWLRLFNTSPNWDVKSNRDFLLWLKERPAGESLGIFASWWYANDWRGSNGQAPTTAQVRENWPQAFRGEGRPVVKKGGPVERNSPLPGGL